MSDSWFPPKGLEKFDRESASRILHLLRVLQQRPIALVIGAGASTSAGLPTWNDLMVMICQVFFDHWRFDVLQGSTTVARPPRALSVAFSEPWDDDILALGEEFAKGNPVLVAQQIKNCIRDLDWIYLLRKCLYGVDNSKQIQNSQLLASLSAFCEDPACVHAVVNYNYDSVFEDYLASKGIRFTVLWGEQQRARRGSLPVYHVHGYLKRGGGPKTRIILAEDDYHEELVAPYSWSNLLQSSLLLQSTCVFVGTSMTDPNLRRLLRSTFSAGKRFHYAFLPSGASSPKMTMLDSLFDRDLYSLGVATIRYPTETTDELRHSWLPRCMDWLRFAIRTPR